MEARCTCDGRNSASALKFLATCESLSVQSRSGNFVIHYIFVLVPHFEFSFHLQLTARHCGSYFCFVFLRNWHSLIPVVVVDCLVRTSAIVSQLLEFNKWFGELLLMHCSTNLLSCIISRWTFHRSIVPIAWPCGHSCDCLDCPWRGRICHLCNYRSWSYM